MTQRRIYQCDSPYHITFNVLNREWIFEDEKKAELLHQIILNAGDLKNHTVYQFAIMPDHVHVLCKTNEPDKQVPQNIAGTEACSVLGWGKYPKFTHRADLCVCDGGKTCCGDCDGFKTISKFIHTIKSFFVTELRKTDGIEYKFFQTRFNFRIITDEDYLETVIHYISDNPIKADLPIKWQEYPYQYKNDDATPSLHWQRGEE